MAPKFENSVVIHQPHFLPWPPYLARVALCETFVVLDDVLYRKRYYHNRTRFLDQLGRLKWGTLPIHANSVTRISDATIDLTHRKIFHRFGNSLHDTHFHSPYFGEVWPAVKSFIQSIGSSRDLTYLAHVNVASILLLLSLLEIPGPKEIIFASAIAGDEMCRTSRLVSLAKHTRSHTYLTGWGASINPKIHDLQKFRQAGISVASMDAAKAKTIEPKFISCSGVSTLHWIFQCGKTYVRDKVTSYLETFVIK